MPVDRVRQSEPVWRRQGLPEAVGVGRGAGVCSTLAGGRSDGGSSGGGYGGGRGDDDYSSGFSTGGANKPSGPKESYDLNDDIPF